MKHTSFTKKQLEMAIASEKLMVSITLRDPKDVSIIVSALIGKDTDALIAVRDAIEKVLGE